jgi:histidyl-tRNA synthetase
MDYLGEASLAHFDGLKRLLDHHKIAYRLNPRLVRGLDYYNLTVFEWIAPQLGAQGTVCGGGRYDGLFAQIGGKPTPAAGFAMGNERLIALLREAGYKPASRKPDAYVLFQGAGTDERAQLMAERLRERGYRVVAHAGGGSFKSQMKKADSSGAAYALIIGEDELAAGEVSLKPLRAEGEQRRIRYERLVEAFAETMAREKN